MSVEPNSDIECIRLYVFINNRVFACICRAILRWMYTTICIHDTECVPLYVSMIHSFGVYVWVESLVWTRLLLPQLRCVAQLLQRQLLWLLTLRVVGPNFSWGQLALVSWNAVLFLTNIPCQMSLPVSLCSWNAFLCLSLEISLCSWNAFLCLSQHPFAH